MGSEARIDWRLDDPSTDRLGIVDLHEHGWSLDLAHEASNAGPGSRAAAEEYRRLVDHWIDHCSLGARGSLDLAWNSHVLSGRICHWVAGFAVARSEVFEVAPDFERRFLETLWVQAAFLHDHVEWDVRGNHLVRNALALALAGRLFDGEATQEWIRAAERITSLVLETQMLGDGAHDEGSPHYHLQVMDELLRISILLPGTGLPVRVRSAWRRMADWLVALAAPFDEPEFPCSREVPALNDGPPIRYARVRDSLAAGDPDASQTHWGSVPPDGLTLLRHSGHVVWRSAVWHLIFDVGDFGSRQQPGHGHADALQLVARAFGRSLFIDFGSSTYDRCPRRAFERSTAAHNTVTVDGQDSAEIWDVFRVGRRPRCFDVEADEPEGELVAGASHDGFTHLPGAPVHRRIVRTEGDRLIIEDRVNGRGQHHVEGGFLIDPHWRLTPGGDASWHLRAGSEDLLLEVTGPSDLRVEERPQEIVLSSGQWVPALRWTWSWSGSLPINVRISLTPRDSRGQGKSGT